MDVQVTKGKRGRPKGSKNKSKNDGDKTSILHKSVGSIEDNSSMEQSVLSQMQSFRNSILEHLKVELFGEGNGSVLPTPPMNLSTLLSPTDSHLESANSSIHSSSAKVVSNLGLKALATERSNNDSIAIALNKSAAEMQPRKRGRPRLSEAQKKNKNKSLSFESEKSNHVQDTTVTTVTNRPLSEAEANKELPLFNHISSSQNKQPNIKKNTTDQSNKDCNDINSKAPEQPLQCLKSPEERNLNIEKEQNEMCRLPPKLMAVEEVLQGLRLSPTNVSCHLKEGEDGSILAQIFTKDCMRSSLKASMRSKILNSDKVLSSFSTFCKRRMIKKTMQQNESKILLGNLSGCNTSTSVQKNSFILNQVASNSILEKENIMRINNDNSKIMNDAASRCRRSLTRDKFVVAESPKLRSTGVQCNERKNYVSVKLQTNFTSYKDASIQTDADLRESRTSDVSVQVTSSSDISLCSKCHGTLEAIAKEYGSSQSEIAPKPAPMLSSSFLNNLNLTNGLIGNPSMLGDTANNKDMTFNLRSSFFDSTFLNELVTETPTSKVSQECHLVTSKSNSNRVVCFPEHIGIPSSEGVNGKLLSANFLDQNKDTTGSLILETTSIIMESAVAAPESTTPTKKDDLLDADDVIIRGNIALSANSGDSINNEQSDGRTFLDEGFINEPSADAQLIDQSLGTEQDEKSVEVLQFHNSRIDGRSRKRKRSTDDDDNGGGDDDDTDDFVLRKQNKRICSLPDESYGKRYASQKINNERKYRDCKRFVEKAKLKSPVYKKIRRCTYVDAKPICKDYEPTSCDCKVAHPDDAKEICCGDSCLNRLVYTECHPSTCPTGDKCSNRRIQKKQWVEGLIKFQTKNRGYGVKTLKSLRPGQFIIEYCGEVVSENEFKRRMSQNYSNERHHYCLNLDSGMVIDGYRMGNISRFINHSCKPNCVMEKWNINGVYRMGLFALETIKSGDELTYDYNFHAYNIHSQQICKCGSENCRGMMAGKNQKMKKNDKSKQTSLKKHSLRKVRPGYLKNSPASLRPAMVNIHASSATASSLSSKTASSTKERIFAQKQRLFLQRNVKKVKKMISNLKNVKFNSLGLPRPNRKEGGFAKDYGCFLRSLPGFEDMFSFPKKPCFRAPNDKAKESTLKHIFTTIINTLSDIDANSLYASRPSLKGLTLPKDPTFVETVQEPLSLEAILNNVHLSHYTSFQDFNEDVNKLFDHIQKREVFNADVEDALLDVKRVYKEASKDVISLYSDIVLKPLAPLQSRMPPVQGIKPATEEQLLEVDKSNNSFSADSKDAEDTEVEVIRCVCNIYKDEGLMIQCEKCEKWQHCVCMNVKGDEDHYTCELCSPRPISKEVLLVPQPEDALAHCRYYMTLMRDEHLQVRVGECVYVTREGSTIDIVTFNNQRSSHLIRDQLDIFRVERLWRKYSGDGFAFGHYYMRPHETFHEPNRKFYPNEVFRAPLYHVVPLEAIVGTCCVMDPVTYCKGHPVGIKTEDIYVCEFRVDKAARLFSKINKSQHMTNTNSYCFHHYPTKLKPKRTYMVHQESDGGGSIGQS